MLRWPIKITPIHLQINPVECGASCLSIALKYYGQNIVLSKIQKLADVSHNGSNASSLLKAARNLGFDAHAYRGLARDLRGKELAILFFDNSHFVIYEGYFLKRFYINDPAKGRYSLLSEEFHKRFSRAYITLKPKFYSEKSLNKKIHLEEIKTKLALIIFGLGFGWLLSLFFMANSVLIEQRPSFLFVVVLLLLFFLLLLGVVKFNRIILDFIRLKNEEISGKFLSLIVAVRPSFFYMRPFARFKEALEYSVSKYDKLPMRFFILGIMLALLVVLAFISLHIFIMLVIASACLMVLLGPRMDSVVVAISLRVRESLRQAFMSYPALMAMGQNKVLFNEQFDNERRLFYARKQYTRLIINALVKAIFLMAIGYLFLTRSIGPMSAEALAQSLLITLTTLLLASFTREENDFLKIRLKSFLDELESQAQDAKKKEQGLLSPYLIEVKHMSFFYPGNEEPILLDIDLILKEQKIYSLIGSKKSGVSTIFKLLAQKISPNKGFIKYNGSRYAIIDEEAELFKGSLWDNLALFNHVDEYEIAHALKISLAEELYFKRPLGLLAEIDDRGQNLSSGQKKRLLLARAILHKPDFLVLDNFFDALDEKMSTSIIKNLRSLPITIIFNSYRWHELQLCDEIFVLNDKKIALKGTHDELLYDDFYRELIGYEAGLS